MLELGCNTGCRNWKERKNAGITIYYEKCPNSILLQSYGNLVWKLIFEGVVSSGAFGTKKWVRFC